MIRLRAAIAGAIVLSACGGADAPTATTPPPTVAPPPTISGGALVHLEQVLGIMQANSIRRTTIDWTAFRSDVLGVAGAAQSISQLAPAIRRAIELLADGHTSYRSGAGTFIFVSRRSCAAQPTVPPIAVPASIGYVRVSGFSGSTVEAAEFSSAIQARIRAQDSDSIRGWIVDLRSNTGGNMWPITTPYRLRRENPRVAVLTDVGTASSGEAITIAFRTRARTRSFGQGTCGLSTANSGFPLNDGGLLNLTTAVMADRTRAAYGDRVVPDEVLPESADVGARAIAWLLAPETP